MNVFRGTVCWRAFGDKEGELVVRSLTGEGLGDLRVASLNLLGI